MKHLLLGILWLTMLLPARAGSMDKDKRKYPVSDIPEEIKKDAKVVVRDYDLSFEVHSLATATQKVHKALTILSKSAKSYSTQYVFYDKFSKVSNISGVVYNANGMPVKKLKGSDIHDMTAIDGFSVYSDNRVKVLVLSVPSYPFTVEYTYQIEKTGLLFYPTWAPQSSNKMAVQHATYSVSMSNSGDELRYKEYNLPEDVVRNIQELSGTYFWEVKNMKVFKSEPYGPTFGQLMPMVRTAPEKFSMGGYKGSLESWSTMGEWINELNEGRAALPPETVAEVQQLVAGISDEHEKIRKVYEYMQDKTRYVSIQLGIGGFQPFTAESVDENGYGDCKALSNYTLALLKSTGIDARYVLVKAGRSTTNIDTSFPSSQFNHAIIAVPMPTDTVWLECTSQTNPFGYLGKFTGDRDVLMVTPKGGEIIHTPVYDADVNLQIRKAEVTVDQEGTAHASVSTEYEGVQYENVNRQLARSRDDRKKWLYNNLDLPNVSVESFDYKENKAPLPTIKENLKFSVKSYATTSGKRYFFKPNLLNAWHDWPKTLKERKTDIYWKTGYTDVDSVHISLPDGFYVEFAPEDVTLQSAFGEYSTHYITNEDGITYVRKIRMTKGTYPASSYQAFTEFIKGVVKSDNTKVVALGKT